MNERRRNVNAEVKEESMTVELLIPAEPEIDGEVDEVTALLDGAGIEHTDTKISDIARVRIAIGSWELVGRKAIGDFVRWQSSDQV